MYPFRNLPVLCLIVLCASILLCAALCKNRSTDIRTGSCGPPGSTFSCCLWNASYVVCVGALGVYFSCSITDEFVHDVQHTWAKGHTRKARSLKPVLKRAQRETEKSMQQNTFWCASISRRSLRNISLPFCVRGIASFAQIRNGF